MVEMNLNELGATSTKETLKPETTAVVTRNDESLAAPAQTSHRRSNAFMKPPTINVVQKIGELGDIFKPGEIVFDKMIPLGSGGPAASDAAIRLVLLKMTQKFVQDIPYGTEDFPEEYPTEDDVLRNGGVLRREDDDGAGRWFRPAADLLVLVRAPSTVPEDMLAMFPYEIDGRHWGAALWYVRKTATAPLIGKGLGRAPLLLGGKLHLGEWNITTNKQTWKTNTYYTPASQFVGKLDPESELAKLAAELAAQVG